MRNLFLIITITLIPSALIAQPYMPATPVDGGLSILLGAGVAYGAKKVFDKQKNDKENE